MGGRKKTAKRATKRVAKTAAKAAAKGVTKRSTTKRAAPPFKRVARPAPSTGRSAGKRAARGTAPAGGKRAKDVATPAINPADVVAPAIANPARTIVYVHGIGNKPTASVLKCQWDHALFGFDLGERSRLAYWVDRNRYPEVQQATCANRDLSTPSAESGDSMGARGVDGDAEPREEVAKLTRDPRERAVLMSLADKMEAQNTLVDPVRYARALEEIGRRIDVEEDFARGAGLSARNMTAAALPVPRFLRELVTKQLTKAFLRDVNDLFFKDDLREAMIKSVMERIEPGGDPFVIIGHSQGSMIAYLTLLALDPVKYRVPLFITIGSPLGITEVKDQLVRLTGQNKLTVPRCVRRWINVADMLDPVALDKKLSSDYQANANGVKIEDDIVWNPDSPRHPHSGSGYLSTRPVRRSVRDTVETGLFQPVAPFALTRDVVQQLEDAPAEARHKVLIELASPDTERSRERIRADVVRTLTENLEGGAKKEDLDLELLERFVAANLTRREAELLAQQAHVKVPPIRRIWRNSAKRALLEKSIHTVQAYAGHCGYGAYGLGVTWAVLDSGIVDHPHFRRNDTIEAVYDCTRRGALTEGQKVSAALDRYGHGAHVAGIIAGEYSFDPPGAGAGAPADGKAAPMPRKITGMAPKTKLRIYKVLDDNGVGEDAWIIKALDHVASTNDRAGSLKIHGVNLSLGGPFDQSTFGCGHSPLCEELRRLWRQGVVVVLAAGNEGFAVLQTSDGDVPANMDLSIGDPANLEESIAVGSVHKENPHTYGISYFSSRGPTADGRQKPDCVAPGERILSCRHDIEPNAQTIEDLYVEMSGTSMAAPHVSGVLAAYLSLRREFIGNPDLLKDILISNCTDLKRDRPMQGAGMPNLVKMLVMT